MTRADDWARIDYRSRAVAIICAIATTLVASVALRHAAMPAAELQETGRIPPNAPDF